MNRFIIMIALLLGCAPSHPSSTYITPPVAQHRYTLSVVSGNNQAGPSCNTSGRTNNWLAPLIVEVRDENGNLADDTVLVMFTPSQGPYGPTLIGGGSYTCGLQAILGVGPGQAATLAQARFAGTFAMTAEVPGKSAPCVFIVTGY